MSLGQRTTEVVSETCHRAAREESAIGRERIAKAALDPYLSNLWRSSLTDLPILLARRLQANGTTQISRCRSAVAAEGALGLCAA